MNIFNIIYFCIIWEIKYSSIYKKNYGNTKAFMDFSSSFYYDKRNIWLFLKSREMDWMPAFNWFLTIAIFYDSNIYFDSSHYIYNILSKSNFYSFSYNFFCNSPFVTINKHSYLYSWLYFDCINIKTYPWLRDL